MEGSRSGGFSSDEDQMRLGAQQAAIIQMQQEMEETAEKSRAAREAQQEVLAMQQQALIEQEQQKRREQEQLRMLQQQHDVGPPGVRPPGTMPPMMMVPSLAPPGIEGLPTRMPPAADESKIPLAPALEKVFALKGVRTQQVGAPADDNDGPPGDEVEVEQEADDDDEETTKDKKKRENKNKKKKKKKKKARKAKQEEQKEEESKTEDPESDVEIEWVQEKIDIEPGDPGFREFTKVFESFKIQAPKDAETLKREQEEKRRNAVPIKAKGVMNLAEAHDMEEDEMKAEEDEKPKLSKKKMKKLSRLSVAELKQLVMRPDVVEMHDVTAHDPKLLVLLKASRNSVPVPRHWCFKRKYLQGKRGFEKPPFDLPGFIKATGIQEMRQALQDKEDSKSLKNKMREKIRPKMGKIDIDYQKLHDAFFKHQTKPKMSNHGDLYYEGKEFETRLKEKKPGNLSDELRTALGMPIGQNSEKYPPPWLIAMQRYGPPPSYPNLKIPGLNAPIPDGTAFGYHAGGWGKPPVDEFGKPLYGDVFGTQNVDPNIVPINEDEIDKSFWGELESESEDEMSEGGEEEEGEEEEEEEADASGLVTPGETGLVTPSGVTSVPVGVETPDMIELRKRRIEDSMEQGGDTPSLYQVLPEKKSNVSGAQMMGSSHVYDVTNVAAAVKSASQKGVEVALNPEELDMDQSAMQAKYDQTIKDQQSHLQKEDLSDMVAEHAAKQQKKRKSKQQDSGKSAKKYKEFKF